MEAGRGRHERDSADTPRVSAGLGPQPAALIFTPHLRFPPGGPRGEPCPKPSFPRQVPLGSGPPLRPWLGLATAHPHREELVQVARQPLLSPLPLNRSHPQTPSSEKPRLGARGSEGPHGSISSWWGVSCLFHVLPFPVGL